MDRSSLPPLRSLPRLFLPGASPEAPIPLPKAEIDKFRKVLRLEQGSQIAVLPNDGTLIRCKFVAHEAIPICVERPQTEPSKKVILAQALPKGDRLETVIRMGTEIGVHEFVMFPSERSVVRWDQAKISDRLRRYRSIAMESAEQSFRSIVPPVQFQESLDAVLAQYPEASVLSESEDEGKVFAAHLQGSSITIVVGPEGGWSPAELALIGHRGYSLGPLVLRTDTAGPVAAALALYSQTT